MPCHTLPVSRRQVGLKHVAAFTAPPSDGVTADGQVWLGAGKLVLVSRDGGEHWSELTVGQ